MYIIEDIFDRMPYLRIHAYIIGIRSPVAAAWHVRPYCDKIAYTTYTSTPRWVLVYPVRIVEKTRNITTKKSPGFEGERVGCK